MVRHIGETKLECVSILYYSFLDGQKQAVCVCEFCGEIAYRKPLFSR